MKKNEAACDYCGRLIDYTTDRFGDTHDTACINCAVERAPADIVDVLYEMRAGIVGGEFEHEDVNEFCMANQLVLLVRFTKEAAFHLGRIAAALEAKKEVADA
jgi:hypothetical protein